MRTHTIDRLNPINDESAAEAMSPDTFMELVRATMDVPLPARQRRSPTTRLGRRGRLAAAGAVGASAAAIVLATAAVEHGPSIITPADAAIVRGVQAALHPPTGSVVVEAVTDVSDCHTPACRVAVQRSHVARIVRFSAITQTLRGARTRGVVLQDPEHGRPGFEIALDAAGHRLYDANRNTSYSRGAFAQDITRGPRGKPVYWVRRALYLADPRGPRWAGSQHRSRLHPGGPPRPPVPVLPTSPTAHLAPPLPPVPVLTLSPAAKARAELGPLRVAGRIVLAGREAIKLVPVRGRGEYDVDPETYYPLREIVVSSDATTTITWSHFQVLPATEFNDRLDSLRARRPSARPGQQQRPLPRAIRKPTQGN